MNPEIIIDITSDIAARGVNEEVLLRQWEKLPEVEAVRKKQVYILESPLLMKIW